MAIKLNTEDAFSPEKLARTEDQNKSFPNAQGQVVPAVEVALEEPQPWTSPMVKPEDGWPSEGTPLTFKPREDVVNKTINSKYILADLDISTESNSRIFVADFLSNKYKQDSNDTLSKYSDTVKAFGLSGNPIADAKAIKDGDTRTHENAQTRIAKDLSRWSQEAKDREVGFAEKASQALRTAGASLSSTGWSMVRGQEMLGEELFHSRLRDELKAEYNKGAGLPIEERNKNAFVMAANKFADEMKDSSNEAFGVEQDFAASNVGGYVAGVSQIVAQAGTLGLGIGAQMYDEGISEAENSIGKTYADMSPLQQAMARDIAGPYTLVATALEGLPLGKILKPFAGKGSKGVANELMKKSFLKEFGAGFLGEAITESAQKQLLGEVAKRVLDDGREVWSKESLKAVLKEGFIAGLVGGTARGGPVAASKALNKFMDPVEGMSAVDMALAQNIVPEAEFNVYIEELYGDQTDAEGMPLQELAKMARKGDRSAAEQLVEATTVEASRGAVEAGLTPSEAEARGKEAAEVADPIEPLVETAIEKEISKKREELTALESAEESTPKSMKQYEKLDKEIQALEAKRIDEIVKGKMMTPYTRGVEAEAKRVEQARLDKADKELEEQDQVIDLINTLSPLSANTTVENMPELAAGGKAIIQGWKDAGFTKKEIEAKSKELMTAQGMPNTRLEDVVQKGSQKSTKTDGSPIQSLIKLFKGANPFTVVEEFAHAEYDREIAEGTVTVEQVREWRKAVEELTDTPDLRGETDEDVKEWVAEQVKARIYGQRNNLSLPESFLKFLDDIISKFKQILSRAKELQDLEASGQLPAGFLEMLDRQGLVGKPQQPLGPETESGTAGPDTPVESLDGEGPEIEWKADESFSIEVDRDSYPTITPEIIATIKGETDTLGVIHIDRMIAGGDYEGVPLQGGMFYPSITENLENNVVWAFNSLNVANDVIDRARKNGGYLQLVLMNEGNVVGNKTFTTIWFNELNKSIAEGRTTKTKALKFLNDQREAASKLKTKIPFRHTKKWKSVAEASEAIISMPQLARGVFYSSRSAADTKARGKHVTYGKMLSAKASKALGLPSTESLVEKLEETAFKGLPTDSIVAVIKIDTDQPAMSAQEAGVTPHLSYGYVVKGKPVAKMKKAPVLTDAFPQLKGKLMSAGQFQSPASLLEDETFSLEVKESMKDVTKRTPEVVEAAAQYGAGKITLDEYNEIVAKADPIKPFTEVPAAATEAEITGALTQDKVPFVGTENFTRKLTSGDRVGARLDIPAYKDHGVWVASVHEPRSGVSSGGAGTKIGYVPTVRLSNVNFATNPFVAFRIATSQTNKSTIATVEGDWVEQSDGMSEAEAKDVLNDPSWVQVGMNPFRHSYFYDRSSNTGAPVVSAEEVIQVGGLVLAKNPVYAPKNDPRFKIMQGKIKPAALEKAGVSDLDATFSLEAPDTPAFKSWFGDSKVVDKNGDTLAVLHGGQADIESFDIPLENDSMSDAERAHLSKLGAWFAGNTGVDKGASRRVADIFSLGTYGNRMGANVTPVYLQIENPKVYKTYADLSDAVANSGLTAIGFREKLQDDYFDGIIVEESDTDFGGLRTDYVVFEPTQIKSAIGNRGTFDNTDPRINYSLEPLSEQDADAEATVAAEERQSRTPERQAFIDYQRELRRTDGDNTLPQKMKLGKLLKQADLADAEEELKQSGNEKIARLVEGKIKEIRKQAEERQDVTESVKALERLINSPEVPMEVRARMRGFGRLAERTTVQGKARWLEQMANKLEAEIDRHYRTRNVRTLRSLLRPFATEYSPNRRKLKERVGEEARSELNFAHRLLNNSEATPPEGMTDERRDELVDIFGDVGNRQSNPTRVRAALDIAGSIAKGGRTARDDFKEQRKQDNADLADQVTAQVLNTEDALDASEITAEERDKNKFFKFFRSAASVAVRGMEGLQQQLNKMDRIKGGVLEAMFLPAAFQAQQTELAMNNEQADQTMKDFETVLGSDSRVAAAWYDDSHKMHQTDIEWINNKKVGMKKRKMTKQQGVSLFMQWLDPSLRPTFTNMGINEATIEQVKKFIGEIGVSEAYYFREKYAEMGIKLNAKHMEVEGIPLDLIDGYGGRARRQRGATKEEDMQMFSKNSAGRPTVKSGSMKERTNSVDYLMFMDADADFTAHSREVNHYISHAELAHNMSAAFLTNEDARNAIKQKHGSAFYRSLVEQIEAIIGGEPQVNDLQKILTEVRSNLTKASLMVKPAIMVKQLTSAPAFAEEIGPVAYAKAAAAMLNPANLKKFMPMIWKSQYVKNRMSSSQFTDVQNSLDARNNIMRSLRWHDWAMINVKIGDIGAVVMGGAPVYYHAYNEAKAAGMTDDQAQLKAEEVFGLASERAQQSSATQAQGSFLRDKTFMRTWFMYLTSPIQYQRNVNTAIGNLVAQTVEWKNDRPSDAKKAAKQAANAFLVYHVLLPQIFQAISSGLVGFTDDEDYIKEKFAKRQLRALLLGNLNTFPVLGSFISSLANRVSGADEVFNSSGSPLVDLFMKTTAKWDKALKDGEDLSKLMDVAIEGSQAFGIPAKTIETYIESITDVSEGNTEHPLLRLGGWSKYATMED